jgi:hypothetical protein
MLSYHTLAKVMLFAMLSAPPAGTQTGIHSHCHLQRYGHGHGHDHLPAEEAHSHHTGGIQVTVTNLAAASRINDDSFATRATTEAQNNTTGSGAAGKHCFVCFCLAETDQHAQPCQMQMVSADCGQMTQQALQKFATLLLTPPPRTQLW